MMTELEMEGFLRGKCVPGDMLVNESNAQYLLRKFNALEEQRDALAAENAALREKMGQLSIEESRFLTDVLTAAGLLAYGKQDKGLAQRIANFCVSKRGNSEPAQLRKGGAA